MKCIGVIKWVVLNATKVNGKWYAFKCENGSALTVCNQTFKNTSITCTFKDCSDLNMLLLVSSLKALTFMACFKVPRNLTNGTSLFLLVQFLHVHTKMYLVEVHHLAF